MYNVSGILSLFSALPLSDVHQMFIFVVVELTLGLLSEICQQHCVEIATNNCLGNWVCMKF